MHHHVRARRTSLKTRAQARRVCPLRRPRMHALPPAAISWHERKGMRAPPAETACGRPLTHTLSRFVPLRRFIRRCSASVASRAPQLLPMNWCARSRPKACDCILGFGRSRVSGPNPTEGSRYPSLSTRARSRVQVMNGRVRRRCCSPASARAIRQACCRPFCSFVALARIWTEPYRRVEVP